MSRPTARPLLALFATGVALAASVLGTTGFSTAAFTARTTATGSVTAAADWTPPTVGLQDPGTSVKGTVPLTATAADVESGVASVTLQYLAPGAGTWVTVCAVTAAPYTCSWSTTALADGTYELRAVATDGAGYSTTSATRSTVVANKLVVTLGDPGDVVRGSVSLQTTLFGAGSLTYSVRVEYAAAGTTTWKTICTNLASPYTCGWVTGGYANGDYDLRAVATAGTVSTTSAVVSDVLVDNLAPTVAVLDPGSPLSGTVTLEATASDAHSGVAQVVLQAARTGGSAWQALCTVTAPPYSCRYDTAMLTDGAWSLRAVATDAAGNTATSATVANRVIDNTVSSVSVNDPGAYLTGIVPVTAAANSSAGVVSVRVQVAPGGTTAWTDVCTDTSAPYSCSWDSTKVADGLYDFRAILVDGTGKTTTSAVLAGRRVDNAPLRGYDVQTANGGAVTARVDAGDTMRLTYTEVVDPATVSGGWTGGALPVTLRLRDGGLLGLNGKSDTIDVLRNGAAVNLGSVNLREDYVKGGKTATFNATMVAGTTTIGGQSVTTITLTVGTLAGGSGLRTAGNPSTTTWTPSGLARDAYGVACSTAPTTELGALDREW